MVPSSVLYYIFSVAMLLKKSPSVGKLSYFIGCYSWLINFSSTVLVLTLELLPFNKPTIDTPLTKRKSSKTENSHVTYLLVTTSSLPLTNFCRLSSWNISCGDSRLWLRLWSSGVSPWLCCQSSSLTHLGADVGCWREFNRSTQVHNMNLPTRLWDPRKVSVRNSNISC